MPLFTASQHGHKTTIQKLIDQGINLNKKDIDGAKTMSPQKQIYNNLKDDHFHPVTDLANPTLSLSLSKIV